MKASARSLFALACMTLVLTSPKTVAQPSAQVAEEAIAIPDLPVHTWVLPNGLTLIVREDRSAPVASVQAWVDTGSIDEDRWLGAGLSHILEHMLFKGTESRDTNAIAQTVQAHGGYINAYTSFDRTVYWIDIPSDGVPVALDILADAMMHSTLPEDEYSKEQEVIRREFAMGFDDPDRMASQLLFRTAYRRHPYRHPVIGYLDVYNKLTRDDVMDYYKARYVPNNMAFIVVGDVDARAVREQVEKLFAEEPRVALEPVFLPAEPKQLGRREQHEEFATELTRMHMAWHIPGVTHRDMPALDVLATILGGGRSSILFRDIREVKGLAHGIDAFAYTPEETGLFGISATVDPDKREATAEAVLGHIRRLQEAPVDEALLEKARRQLLSQQLARLTTMRGQASDLGSDWLVTGNLRFGEEYLAAIQDVTAADLRRVAQAYLTDDNLTYVSLNPPDSIEKQEFAAAVAEPPAIESFTLSNGLRVLVREDRRLPFVDLVAVFRGGLLAEKPSNNGLTRLLAHSLIKGTRQLDAAAIAENVESVGGSIGSDSGNNSFTVQLKVLRPDFANAAHLLAAVLTEPTFPKAEVEREKALQISAIKAENDQLTAVTSQLLKETLFADHPYSMRSSGTVVAVEKLTRADLENAWRELVVAENAVVAVFGDISADQVQEVLEKELARLPKGTQALPNPPQPAPVTEERFAERNEPKAQAVLMVGFPGVALDSDDRVVLDVIDEACSDLSSRFFVKIREEMGLAYFVGSSHLAGLSPGMFLFYVGTDPAKVDQVKAALMAEIRNLAEHGLTPEELERAKEKLLGSELISNQSNARLAYMCALDELYGLGAQSYLEYPARVRAVTLDEVKAAAAKYFGSAPPTLALTRPADTPEATAPAEGDGARSEE